MSEVRCWDLVLKNNLNFYLNLVMDWTQPGGQKVGLSMKVVNQTTGQDLDPNQVQTS